jgi:O-glycosyl hydrolase
MWKGGTRILTTIVLATVLLNHAGKAANAQSVLVDPAITYQQVEGWGGSLCWWANIMGGYSENDILKICDWITDPDGLNMNIFRFNIGGGDDPTHSHMRGDGGDMPGYKASADAPYDWTQDANQRRILQQLIASRVAQTGNNDIILEAFSNSPPYWMTVSGCSAGSVEGNVPNLRSDMYEAFADYLTEVVKYYHDSLGITFHSLEPFNEPYSTWWKAFGGQEGCYFGQAEQEKMIRILYDVMEQKNMLGYCTITAMDANSLDECYNGIKAYKQEGDILPKLSKISVHSYFGSENARKNLAFFCHENNIPLWQTESGPLNMRGTSDELILAMAARIVRDMREMKTPVWIDWQLAADNSPQWGILVGKYSEPTNPVTKGYAYYIRSQFSRFIKQGYTIIDVKDEKTLAAMDPDRTELVIVVANETAADASHSYDLGAFSITGTGERYRTREVNASYREKVFKTSLDLDGEILEYTAPAYSVTTFVIPVEVPSATLGEGRYYIRNKAAGQYIGISEASTNAGAQLVVAGESAGAHTSFDVAVDPLRGGFIMKPGHLEAGSNLVLDVEGVSNADGANIMQYADWGGENQRFHFVHLEDNYFRILVRRSMKAWSIEGGDLEIGTPVVQMTWDGEDRSIFEILANPLSVADPFVEQDLVVHYYAGTLNIRSPESRTLSEIYILNMLGKILRHERDIHSSQASLSIDFDPGVYVVRATLSDGLMANDLFMKL